MWELVGADCDIVTLLGDSFSTGYKRPFDTEKYS